MKNPLFPIFLKEHNNILLGGGGPTAFEKLTFLVKSNPTANIQVVSPYCIPEVIQICKKHSIPILSEYIKYYHFKNKQIVILAINDIEEAKRLKQLANKKGVLVNVADTPDLCDFYLGGIVTKGNVKIGISTNGTSPTLAKRLRQILEEYIPEEIDQLSNSLLEFRNQLNEFDFEEKVKILEEHTQSILANR